MSNRRLEVFHYRQALHLMQQKQSDRAIAKSGLMRRQKAGLLRVHALKEGWLEPGAVLPDDATLAAAFDTPKKQVAGPTSSLESHRELIQEWVEQKVNGCVIHRVLTESHGYRGSYASVNRMIRRITATMPVVTTVLDFEPGHTAQIDPSVALKSLSFYLSGVTKLLSYVREFGLNLIIRSHRNSCNPHLG